MRTYNYTRSHGDRLILILSLKHDSWRGQAHVTIAGRAWVERGSSECSSAAGAGLGLVCTPRATQVQHGGIAHTALRASGGLARARGAGGRRAVGVRTAPPRRAVQRHLLAIHVRDHAALHEQEAEQGALVVEEAHEKAVPEKVSNMGT